MHFDGKIPAVESQQPDSPSNSSSIEQHSQRRIPTLYDAVAGRLKSTHLFDGHVSPTTDSFGESALAPEEALFQAIAAPPRFEEGDIYFSHEKLPNAGRNILPDSDLLKAVHSYASRFYDILAMQDERRQEWEGLDSWMQVEEQEKEELDYSGPMDDEGSERRASRVDEDASDEAIPSVEEDLVHPNTRDSDNGEYDASSDSDKDSDSDNDSNSDSNTNCGANTNNNSRSNSNSRSRSRSHDDSDIDSINNTNTNSDINSDNNSDYDEAPQTSVDERSMDETALLAIGILLEEASRSVLGRSGDLVFTEPDVEGSKKARRRRKRQGSSGDEDDRTMRWEGSLHKRKKP